MSAAPVELARGDVALQVLSLAVQAITLSGPDAPLQAVNPEEFEKLHEVLADAYPELYETVEVETVNNYTLVYTWPGTDPSLRPMLLISHIDVVPAPAKNWTYPPFSGKIDDEYVWGRGTLDTKGSVVAILEAMEELRLAGWTPNRTVIFAAGHDEENGGLYGAKAASALLTERYPDGLESIIDEGGFTLLNGLGPMTAGVLEPSRLAMVGMAEKGVQTWDIDVLAAGGHSSLPPAEGHSTTAIIGKMISALDHEQMPAKFQPPATDLVAALYPLITDKALKERLSITTGNMTDEQKTAIANTIAKVPALTYLVRTVHGVVGVTSGGYAHNVLPGTGSVTVNFRTIQGDTTEEVETWLRNVTANPLAKSLTYTQAGNVMPPSQVTPADGPQFAILKQAVMETLGEIKGDDVLPIHVIPNLMSGGTDSRHYQNLAPRRTLRYEPFGVTMEDLSLLHAIDERIRISSFLNGIKFYIRYIQLAAAPLED